ncbi:IS630 family transposase [Prosthecobacter sp.]|uniref:IS630 family transposase n=1 Tax=Prosthecobacter sp. TaxID=1965333 RepID=UPI0037849792
MDNATLDEVRVAMDCTPTKKGFRRLQALLWLYEGKSREEVAALSRFSLRQVLRFIKAFNLAGLDGLIPGRSSGRSRILPKAQVAEKIVPIIEDPALAGQTHWTAVKLHGWIKEHLQTQLGYSTMVRYLHEQDYKLKVPRPWPLKQDEELREAFCVKLRAWQQNPQTDVWFCDESGFEGDPRPRRTWTKIGKVRLSPYLGEHIRHNLFGAVCPADGRLTAMLFNLCDSASFQVFLDTLAQENPQVPGRRAIVVLDNASWHKVKRLNWHHFEPEYLPARSPDLNAIERLWLRMKADWFNGWIAKSAQELQERLIASVQSLFEQPAILQSQCRPKTSL